MQDRLRSIWENPRTRREALKLGLVFAAGGVANRLLGPNTQTPESPVVVNTVLTKEKTMAELLQEILDVPPFVRPHVGSPERIRKESEYLGRVSENPTLEDIDRGFWVLSHQPARAELLELRYNLRLSGKEKRLGQIPDEKIKWAIEHRIHPEVLGVVLDNYERARKKIANLDKDDKLRDDHRKLKEPDEGMINAGGLAMLITMETGPINFLGESFGFSNIGQDMAINQMFGGGAQDDKLALEALSDIFFKKTGLRLNPKNIVGSVKGEDDESGGAVAVQFRPKNAEKTTKLIETVTGELLNVFDINDAPVMIWVFIARHEWVGKDANGNDLYRVGYRRGVGPDITNAIVKWYGAPGVPATKTEKAAYDYHPKFIEGKPPGTS